MPNDIVGNIKYTGIEVLKTVKVIFWGVLIIFIVYVGIQMIVSLGRNEEELKKAKTSLQYAAIGLAFINIPGSIYNAFRKWQYGTTIDGRTGYTSFVRTPGQSDNNLFIDMFSFWQTLNQNIIWFLEVSISGMAILMIIISGIKIIISRGKEEELTKQRTKITWSILWLIFIGFIESWKYVAFKGNIDDGVNLFETISNLALFFAGPIAMFFLTLAAYYYITSNGEEERIKKAKTIVINTVLATIILLASYTFLLDLATL